MPGQKQQMILRWASHTMIIASGFSQPSAISTSSSLTDYCTGLRNLLALNQPTVQTVRCVSHLLPKSSGEVRTTARLVIEPRFSFFGTGAKKKYFDWASFSNR